MKRTMLWSTLHFSVGGVGTYAMRMFKWAKKRGYRNVLILEIKDDVDELWHAQLEENDVEIYYRDIYDIFRIPEDSKGNKLGFEAGEKVLGIATLLDQFVGLQCMQLRFNKATFRNLFYVLHPRNVCVDGDNWYDKKICKMLFYRQLNDNNLLFMDEDSRQFFCKYYDMENNRELFPIGFEIEPLNIDVVNRRTLSKSKKFVILTIGRFEIPFKGYLISAIDTYAKLREKHPDVELYIIGSGEGGKAISRKISSLKSELKQGIKLLGKVEYKKIYTYIDEANVMIALGTCVMDGAMRGLPIVVSTAYQYKGKSKGLFNKCKSMGEIYSKHNEYMDELELVEKIYDMKETDYTMLQWDTYDTYVANHNLDTIMKNMSGLKVKKINLKVIINIYMYYVYKKICGLINKVR